MKSRLNRFILISLLIHLLILMLFSFQEVERIKINSLTIDLNIGSQSSSSLSKQNSTSQAQKSSRQNQQLQKTSSQSFRDLSKPPQKKRSKSPVKSTTQSKKTTSSEKKTTPTLIRNTPPPVSRPLRSFSDADENDIYNRQITLEKSSKKIQSSHPSSETPDQGDGESGNGSDVSGFGEKSVFNQLPAGSSGSGDQIEGFGLKSLSGSTGGSGEGKSRKSGDASGQQSGGFNWKNSGQRSLISKSELVFPKNLEGKGVDEDIVVVFKVAPDGKVYEIELVKSSGYSELDNAVKNQVRSFRFNSISGNKVSEVEYNYLFKLEEKK